MCGRFYFKSNKDKLSHQFSVENAVGTRTNYNVTPSSKCTVVRLNPDNKEFANLTWGLVPSWAKPDNKIKPINAKAETVREKPCFRNAFNKHRCIIPVSGFYEWQGSKGDKRPYAIYPLNDDYFGLAGLWEKREDLQTFTIITTEANEVMRSVHHRMPVILDTKNYDVWLEEGDYALMKPCASEEMGLHIVPRQPHVDQLA